MISTMSENQKSGGGHTNRAFQNDEREYVNRFEILLIWGNMQIDSSVSGDLEMGPNGRKIKKIPVKEYTYRDVVIGYVRSCTSKLRLSLSFGLRSYRFSQTSLCRRPGHGHMDFILCPSWTFETNSTRYSVSANYMAQYEPVFRWVNRTFFHLYIKLWFFCVPVSFFIFSSNKISLVS